MRCGLLPPTRYDFYPRPPRGGRPCSCRRRVPPAGISIHALREEGDITVLIPNTYSKTFLSTPSARRATDDLIQIDFRDQISIHALREEGDRWKNQGSRGGFISIHALREEGDRRPSLPPGRLSDFYPRPPRGGRRARTEGFSMTEEFLSTPSARRTTEQLDKEYHRSIFLSTPSARRATRPSFTAS